MPPKSGAPRVGSGWAYLRRRRNDLARQVAKPRAIVRNQVNAGLVKVLGDAFKISEDERLIPLNRATESSAKLVTLKAGNCIAVEEVARIKVAVTQELV